MPSKKEALLISSSIQQSNTLSNIHLLLVSKCNIYSQQSRLSVFKTRHTRLIVPFASYKSHANKSIFKMTTNSFGTSPIPKFGYEPVFSNAVRSGGLPMSAKVAATAAATGLG